MITTSFIDCKVLVLNIKATGIHDLVDSIPKALYAYEIIWTLKTKFQSLKAQGLWSTAETKKVDTDGEMAGLNLTMNEKVEFQKRGQRGKKLLTSRQQIAGIDQNYLFTMPQKRHFKDNYPLAKKAGKISGKTNPETSGS